MFCKKQTFLHQCVLKSSSKIKQDMICYREKSLKDDFPGTLFLCILHLLLNIINRYGKYKVCNCRTTLWTTLSEFMMTLEVGTTMDNNGQQLITIDNNEQQWTTIRSARCISDAVFVISCTPKILLLPK